MFQSEFRKVRTHVRSVLTSGYHVNIIVTKYDSYRVPTDGVNR